MNYKDVALLNDSLDQLGQGLLRKRMLDMQEEERKAQTGFQQQRLNVDQSRWESQQAHNQAMESKADQANQLAQNRADANDDQALMKTIINLNSSGQLTQQSRANVNQFLENHPRFGNVGIQLTEPKQTAPQPGQNSLAQALQQADRYDSLASEAQQQYDAAESDQEKAAASANIKKYNSYASLLRDSAQNIAHPDKMSAADMEELKSLNSSLRDVDHDARQSANQTPDRAKLRAANAQRVIIEGKKKELLAKYQNRGAAAAGGAAAPAAQPKPLDDATAAQILKEAGGDKAKARKMAADRGYTF